MKEARTYTFAHEDGNPHHLRRPYQLSGEHCTTVQPGQKESKRMAWGECVDCGVGVQFTPTAEDAKWVRGKKKEEPVSPVLSPETAGFQQKLPS